MEREHNSLASLLNTLAFVHTETDLGRFRARERKWTIIAVILALLIFLSTMAKVLSNAIHHVQAHDWWSLAADMLSSLPGLLIPLIFPAALKSLWGSSTLPDKVLELRGRLNNETLVPSVAEQPQSFEAGELPFAPTRVGPVRRVKSLSMLCIGVSVFLLFIDVVLGALVVAILPWIQVPDSTMSNLWAALASSLLLLLCVFFTVLVLVLAMRLLRASKVVVDEWGLRWKWPNLIKGRSVILAWHDITGFYEITSRENKSNPVKIYVLDSSTSTFVWPLRESSTQREQRASTYLTRLVVTCTGLPLRDLTNVVEPLLAFSPEPSVAQEMTVRSAS